MLLFRCIALTSCTLQNPLKLEEERERDSVSLCVCAIGCYKLMVISVVLPSFFVRESESEAAQSCPTLCNPMDYIACQAPPSIGFSRQEYWNRLLFPSPGIFPTQGWNVNLPHCRQTPPSLSHQGSPIFSFMVLLHSPFGAFISQP